MNEEMRSPLCCLGLYTAGVCIAVWLRRVGKKGIAIGISPLVVNGGDFVPSHIHIGTHTHTKSCPMYCFGGSEWQWVYEFK